MEEKLYSIRSKKGAILTIQQKLYRAFLVLLLGGTLGFLAKYVDGSSVGLIGTELGFWVVLTTIIAAWSRSPIAAAIHVFIFLLAMITVYYLYSMALFGFFPKYYFIVWGSFAMLSPIGGYILWFARGSGWIAALCAAFPISFLFVEGMFFFDTITIPLYHLSLAKGFALVSAIVLFAILPKNNFQRLRIFPLLIILYFVIDYLEVGRYLPS